MMQDISLGRLAKNRLAVVGLVVIAIMVVMAILADIIAPYAPNIQDYSHTQESPSLSHPMGTDILGRDVLSRIIYGTRISLAIGIFTQFIIVIIGVPLGTLAGIAGNRFDNLIMRFTDIVYAFPDLLLIILFRFIFGGGVLMMFLAIGLVSWTNIARLTRGQILSLKNQEFVTASQAMGASNIHIIRHHLLPNSMGPIIVAMTFGIPRAIFAEAALSYIGIGIAPPTPSWGGMIEEGTQAIFNAPHLILFPALCIAILMLAFTFLGDGLRDVLDPKTKE
ncbi:MAG: ABC transporter permease [Chloroflexota bacterium]|nr:ABC transporter permease [Chloroflexota bacterium]